MGLYGGQECCSTHGFCLVTMFRLSFWWDLVRRDCFV
jgi:hypothetical protein